MVEGYLETLDQRAIVCELTSPILRASAREFSTRPLPAKFVRWAENERCVENERRAEKERCPENERKCAALP